MSRAQRLLSLLQMLRTHRFPIAGAKLADQLGVSLRTLYRDMDALRAQGAEIDGDAGVGFILKPGFLLPPLMFSEDELEAVALGAGGVKKSGDESLAKAANNALYKIASVLPDAKRHALDAMTLFTGEPDEGDARLLKAELPPIHGLRMSQELDRIRHAIRNELKIHLMTYDAEGRPAPDIVWPFSLSYFREGTVLRAFRELPQKFQSYSTRHVSLLSVMEQRYPKYHEALYRDWTRVRSADRV